MVFYDFHLRCVRSDHYHRFWPVLEFPHVGVGGEAKSTGSLLAFSKRGGTLSNLNISFERWKRIVMETLLKKN